MENQTKLLMSAVAISIVLCGVVGYQEYRYIDLEQKYGWALEFSKLGMADKSEIREKIQDYRDSSI